MHEIIKSRWHVCTNAFNAKRKASQTYTILLLFFIFVFCSLLLLCIYFFNEYFSTFLFLCTRNFQLTANIFNCISRTFYWWPFTVWSMAKEEPLRFRVKEMVTKRARERAWRCKRNVAFILYFYLVSFYWILWTTSIAITFIHIHLLGRKLFNDVMEHYFSLYFNHVLGFRRKHDFGLLYAITLLIAWPFKMNVKKSGGSSSSSKQSFESLDVIKGAHVFVSLWLHLHIFVLGMDGSIRYGKINADHTFLFVIKHS